MYKPYKVSVRFKLIKEWWAQVAEIPEYNNKRVFKKGIDHGLIKSIPIGGHIK